MATGTSAPHLKALFNEIQVALKKDGVLCFAFGRSDREGRLSFKSPKGITDAILNLAGGHGIPTQSFRWRESKEGPLRGEQQAMLGALDRDMTGLEVVAYRSPTVIVKVTDGDGKPIPKIKAKIFYPEEARKVIPALERRRAEMARPDKNMQISPEEKTA